MNANAREWGPEKEDRGLAEVHPTAAKVRAQLPNNPFYSPTPLIRVHSRSFAVSLRPPP